MGKDHGKIPETRISFKTGDTVRIWHDNTWKYGWVELFMGGVYFVGRKHHGDGLALDDTVEIELRLHVQKL